MSITIIPLDVDITPHDQSLGTDTSTTSVVFGESTPGNYPSATGRFLRIGVDGAVTDTIVDAPTGFVRSVESGADTNSVVITTSASSNDNSRTGYVLTLEEGENGCGANPTPNLICSVDSGELILVFYGRVRAYIDFGDGVSEAVNSNETTTTITHFYETVSSLAVSFAGTHPRGVHICGDALTSVQDWGAAEAEFIRFNTSEASAPNLISVPGALPPSLISLQQMFEHAVSFDCDISEWNTSNITSMKAAFRGATSFKSSVSDWDVSSVTSFDDAFNSATSFNSDISMWDVSNAHSMSRMFNNATSFSGDLSQWCVRHISTRPDDFDTSSNIHRSPLWGWNRSLGIFSKRQNEVTNSWSQFNTLTESPHNGKFYGSALSATGHSIIEYDPTTSQSTIHAGGGTSITQYYPFAAVGGYLIAMPVGTNRTVLVYDPVTGERNHITLSTKSTCTRILNHSNGNVYVALSPTGTTFGSALAKFDSDFSGLSSLHSFTTSGAKFFNTSMIELPDGKLFIPFRMSAGINSCMIVDPDTGVEELVPLPLTGIYDYVHLGGWQYVIVSGEGVQVLDVDKRSLSWLKTIPNSFTSDNFVLCDSVDSVHIYTQSKTYVVDKTSFKVTYESWGGNLPLLDWVVWNSADKVDNLHVRHQNTIYSVTLETDGSCDTDIPSELMNLSVEPGELEIEFVDGAGIITASFLNEHDIILSEKRTYTIVEPATMTIMYQSDREPTELIVAGDAITSVNSWSEGPSRIAFYGDVNSPNLQNVPEQLPTSITIVDDMFKDATSFNSDVSGWDVGSVLSFNGMFNGAASFNQNLSEWCVITDPPHSGFNDGSALTEENAPKWGWPCEEGFVGDFVAVNTANGTLSVDADVAYIIWSDGVEEKFTSTYSREVDGTASATIHVEPHDNHGSSLIIYGDGLIDVTDWDMSLTSHVSFEGSPNLGTVPYTLPSSITSLHSTFKGAETFNLDVSYWDVRRVSDMTSMFEGAVGFDQDLSDWCVPLISEEPVNFDTGANNGDGISVQPLWGDVNYFKEIEYEHINTIPQQIYSKSFNLPNNKSVFVTHHNTTGTKQLRLLFVDTDAKAIEYRAVNDIRPGSGNGQEWGYKDFFMMSDHHMFMVPYNAMRPVLMYDFFNEQLTTLYDSLYELKDPFDVFNTHNKTFALGKQSLILVVEYNQDGTTVVGTSNFLVGGVPASQQFSGSAVLANNGHIYRAPNGDVTSMYPHTVRIDTINNTTINLSGNTGMNGGRGWTKGINVGDLVVYGPSNSQSQLNQGATVLIVDATLDTYSVIDVDSHSNSTFHHNCPVIHNKIYSFVFIDGAIHLAIHSPTVNSFNSEFYQIDDSGWGIQAVLSSAGFKYDEQNNQISCVVRRGTECRVMSVNITTHKAEVYGEPVNNPDGVVVVASGVIFHNRFLGVHEVSDYEPDPCGEPKNLGDATLIVEQNLEL